MSKKINHNKGLKKASKSRMDDWLVNEGICKDLTEARRVLMSGRIREAASGEILDKPGQLVPANLKIQFASGESKFVSRGGDKLNAFLDHVQMDVCGLRVLDVGSSTGGFSDCLLQRGAREIICVDVGTHQLHEKLRADSRIRLYENTDIRRFDLSAIREAIDLVVVDVAFISLKLVIPVLVRELRPSVTYIFLFKPQFEVDRFAPKKRGVAHASDAKKAQEEMLLFLRSMGLNPLMIQASALKGTKGNQEVFMMAKSDVIPKHIFRTYDIRGYADRELSNYTMERIGRALGKRLCAKIGTRPQIGLGRDARYSSPRIYKSLARGLSHEGVHVVDLGLTTTPMAYFGHYAFDLDGMIQVTASHNPKDDNGMKMMIAKNTLFGEEISSLGEEAAREVFDIDESQTPRLLNRSDELKERYLAYLHENLRLSKKFRVILDCGNGMAGAIAREAFAPYCESLEILYESVDCSFPNHEADPTIPANLVELQKRVVASGADVGFAFDGDADRLGVITAKGRILWGDEILMLLSELVLRQSKGKTIIGEVKCSEKLFRMIREKGGEPLMYKTGHSLIKKKMKEVGAPIAGEMSGHLFFADRYFGFDDAIYGAIRVMEVMDQLFHDLDSWIASYPASFVTPEIRVDCEESEKTAAVERVKEFFQSYPEAHLSLMDGVRVGFPDGSWALVRASNTQAVLVVRVEAISEARLMEVKGLVAKALGRPI